MELFHFACVTSYKRILYQPHELLHAHISIFKLSGMNLFPGHRMGLNHQWVFCNLTKSKGKETYIKE